MTTKEKKQQLKNESRHDFTSLLTLVEVLRGEGGCPWDREQTHESIRNDLIEETYEVVEAIDNGDRKLLREELGDVMFQVAFHSQIEREAGGFTIEDVIDEVCGKMISRHPHVFGDVSVSGSREVLDNWETIKKAEKDRKTTVESMNSVPKQLPALMRAKKIVKKARKDSHTYTENEDTIIALAEKLKTAPEGEREVLLADIIFASVVLGGSEADLERQLGEKVNGFIEHYKSTNEKINDLIRP